MTEKRESLDHDKISQTDGHEVETPGPAYIILGNASASPSSTSSTLSSDPVSPPQELDRPMAAKNTDTCFAEGGVFHHPSSDEPRDGEPVGHPEDLIEPHMVPFITDITTTAITTHDNSIAAFSSASTTPFGISHPQQSIEVPLVTLCVGEDPESTTATSAHADPQQAWSHASARTSRTDTLSPPPPPFVVLDTLNNGIVAGTTEAGLLQVVESGNRQDTPSSSSFEEVPPYLAHPPPEATQHWSRVVETRWSLTSFGDSQHPLTFPLAPATPDPHPHPQPQDSDRDIGRTPGVGEQACVEGITSCCRGGMLCCVAIFRCFCHWSSSNRPNGPNSGEAFSGSVQAPEDAPPLQQAPLINLHTTDPAQLQSPLVPMNNTHVPLGPRSCPEQQRQPPLRHEWTPTRQPFLTADQIRFPSVVTTPPGIVPPMAMSVPMPIPMRISTGMPPTPVVLNAAPVPDSRERKEEEAGVVWCGWWGQWKASWARQKAERKRQKVIRARREYAEAFSDSEMERWG